MRLCIYEDLRTSGFGPLTLTRPVFDLLCGFGPIDSLHRRHFRPSTTGYLVRPELASVARFRRPNAPVNDSSWLRSTTTILSNSRWLPPAGTGPIALPNEPLLAICRDEIAYAILTPEFLSAISPLTLDDCLADWYGTIPWKEVGGIVARSPGDWLAHNPLQIERDFDAVLPSDGWSRWPAGVSVLGPADRVFIDPSADVEPNVLIDARQGPVVVAAKARIAAFTRLDGPCVIGAGCVLERATIRGGTTLGPGCQVGGLIDGCIVQGFLDRPQDGSLMASAIGEWVTIGPYGWVNGAVIGDQARLAAGINLPTKAVVGAFASMNLDRAPRLMPSYEMIDATGEVEPALWSEIHASVDATLARHDVRPTEPLVNLYRSIVTGKESPRVPAWAKSDREGILRKAG